VGSLNTSSVNESYSGRSSLNNSPSAYLRSRSGMGGGGREVVVSPRTSRRSNNKDTYTSTARRRSQSGSPGAARSRIVSPHSSRYPVNTAVSPNRRANGTSPNFYVERAKELKSEWGALCEKNPHFLSPRSQQRASEATSRGVNRDLYIPSASDVDGHIPGTHFSRERSRALGGAGKINSSRNHQPFLQRNQSPPSSASNRPYFQPPDKVSTPQDGIVHPNVSPIRRKHHLQLPPSSSSFHRHSHHRDVSPPTGGVSTRTASIAHPASLAADRASPVPSGLLAAGGGQQVHYSGGGGVTQSSPRYAAPTASSLEHGNLKYQVEYVLTRREELSQISQHPGGSEALEVAYGGRRQSSPRSQSRSRHTHHHPVGGEHNTSLEVARSVAQQLVEGFGGGSPSRGVSASSMSQASPPTTHRRCEDGLCNTLGLR
jgi:hypothetical protein